MATKKKSKKPAGKRRAEKRPPGCPSATERAVHIADLMARGQYRTHITACELSTTWGIAYGTVKNDASVASKIIKVSEDQREDLRTRVSLKFEAIAEDALTTRNEMTGMPDFGAAIRATELAAKYLGLEPEAKVHHTGEIALESLDAIRARMKDAPDK